MGTILSARGGLQGDINDAITPANNGENSLEGLGVLKCKV